MEGNQSTEKVGYWGVMKVQRVWVLGGNESTNRVDTGGGGNESTNEINVK